MESWYIFSALGFYPVCPGSDHYAIGSPLFKKATIHLENGKDFTVVASGNDNKSIYINSAKLNGINFTKSYLMYDEVKNGGVLQLEMSSEPNKNFNARTGNIQ